MFEWLEEEIASIKTPGFHIIDGPAKGELRDAVNQSSLSLPSSYKEFVIKFGNAKLYRVTRNNSYQVGVFAGPRERRLDDGRLLYEIGFNDSARVYIEPGNNSTVWEGGTESKRIVQKNFSAWLKYACSLAREHYSAEEWSNILRGPNPFTAEEQSILAARRNIFWKVVGIDVGGSHIFEVKNSSERTLPMLTIGVRSIDGRLNGATVLRIGHIGPGHTATIFANCYKELKSPNEIEVFDLPEPRPENREYFAELKGADRGRGKGADPIDGAEEGDGP